MHTPGISLHLQNAEPATGGVSIGPGAFFRAAMIKDRSFGAVQDQVIKVSGGESIRFKIPRPLAGLIWQRYPAVIIDL
jgi:hypothetical protein